ncbi:MAG: BNR-4 repeat-containing protein [Planctomycetota bacterium]
MRAFIPLALLCSALANAQDIVHGRLISFNENGAWCWFEDERALVDTNAGRLLVASCADSSGVGGAARDGDIDVAWLDLAAGRFGAFELHDRLQDDDHSSPALMVRPDGRYVAMYGTHGSTPLSYWRVSDPGNPAVWTPTSTYNHGAGLTYSNLYHIPDPTGATPGLTYNFCRALNYDPNVMRSVDGGLSWSGGGKLFTEGGSGDRPYARYASDGTRVDVIVSDRHPRNYDNSIYHGYVANGALHDSAGTIVDGDVMDSAGVRPRDVTAVFQTGTVFNGTVMRRAWTIDVQSDGGGRVRALFQARANDSAQDHRLFFGEFDGTSWSVHEVCRLGGYLYAAEDDYTGLAALDPNDRTRTWVSTKIDPRTGATTAHYELYAGRTADQGATWSFTAVTEGSTVDNLRPIVPAWDAERTALLWYRGTYSTYTDFDTAIVGTITAPELPFDAAQYYDATDQNTTRADGSPVSATGPSANQGANDGRWHRLTGLGNGGEVWASSDAGGENAPLLRTRLSGLAPGVHDVYVAFWSNPTSAWSLRAGLAPTALRHLEKKSAQSVGSSDFAGSVVISGPGVRLYHAWLGRADVPATGELDVYVDDIDVGQSGLTRTWYDGVAVARVTCAPTLRYCDALPNSSGVPARIDRSGTCSVAANDLVLYASSAPSGAWSVFVYGHGRTSTPLADGRLCIATSLGRMSAQQVDFLGSIARPLDLSAPLGSGGAVAVGETWSFQLWFRDSTPSGANLSDAIEVTFSG